MTPAGGAVVFVLVAAVLVLVLGPRRDETPAFVVIAVVVAIWVISAAGMSAGGGTGHKSLAQRRAEFHPVRRGLGEAPESEVEAEAWQRERDRYVRSHATGDIAAGPSGGESASADGESRTDSQPFGEIGL
jgi:hypothetical protein